MRTRKRKLYFVYIYILLVTGLAGAMNRRRIKWRDRASKPMVLLEEDVSDGCLEDQLCRLVAKMTGTGNMDFNKYRRFIDRKKI